MEIEWTQQRAEGRDFLAGSVAKIKSSRLRGARRTYNVALYGYPKANIRFVSITSGMLYIVVAAVLVRARAVSHSHPTFYFSSGPLSHSQPWT
jgi:hypothetical protein